jgi:hypothetical protein
MSEAEKKFGTFGRSAEANVPGRIYNFLRGKTPLWIDRVPGDGVRAAVFSGSPAGRAGFPQAATAGSVKIGSSLNGAMVSRVM